MYKISGQGDFEKYNEKGKNAFNQLDEDYNETVYYLKNRQSIKDKFTAKTPEQKALLKLSMIWNMLINLQ